MDGNKEYPPGHEVSQAVETVCNELAEIYRKMYDKAAANIAENVAAIVRDEGWKPKS